MRTGTVESKKRTEGYFLPVALQTWQSKRPLIYNRIVGISISLSVPAGYFQLPSCHSPESNEKGRNLTKVVFFIWKSICHSQGQ